VGITSDQAKVLAAHLFAWAVLRARIQKMVWSGEPYSDVEHDQLVRWAMLVNA
jgi:hypothetical protein